MSYSKIQTVRTTPMRICDSVLLDSGVTIPCIQGQCSQVDEISQNGYRYKRGFWEKVLNQDHIKAAIEARDILGMIEHPEKDDDFLKTPYEEASHVVLKAWIEDGNPFAQFGLLNNTKGCNIKALIEVGHRPGVSTRGMGEFDQDEISQFVSPDGYVFLTWDLVKAPNFATLKMDKVTDSLKSNPLFREITQMIQLRDSADEHYHRANLLKDIEKAESFLRGIRERCLLLQ